MPRIARHLHRIDSSQFRREEASDSDSDDESDESSVGTIDAAAAVSSNALRCEVTSSTRMKNKKHMNEDGEEWKNSKQKKDIIAAFLDDESGIQSMSPAQIFDTYADGLDGRSRIQWQTFEG